MAKRKAKADDTPSEQPAVPFETALQDLETIVAALEDGSLGLEEAMQKFEEGVKLLKTCYAQLENAEQRIETLVAFDDEGRPRFKPFDATATIDKGSD